MFDDNNISEHVYLEDYKLRPNYEAISGHICWAFGTRKAYYDGELRSEIMQTLAQHETCSRSFLRIAHLATIGNNRPDKRASAIELAFAENILIRNNVELVILPRQFLEDPCGDNQPMIEGLAEANINWECYDWEPNLTPEDFREEITSLVREYYVRNEHI